MITSRRSKLEVLAPAGNREHLLAAIAAGADAVYLGIQGLSARPQAWDFCITDAAVAVRTLHDEGRRLYVALNASYGEYNASEMARTVQQVAEIGADAVIVADWGLLRLVQRLGIAIPVHASTLLGIHNVAAVDVARRLGVSRLILSTNLQLHEMAAIIEACADIEFELIAHGGLCFHDNRCCRLPHYEIDGNFTTACGLDYYVADRAEVTTCKLVRLHAQEVDLSETLALYAALGVTAFKIEGRTRSSRYVSMATDRLRAAVDRLPVDLQKNNLPCYVARVVDEKGIG